MAASDIQEIKALNATYNFAMDDGDPDAWAGCFTKNGAFNALMEGQKPVGTEALKAFVGVCRANFGQMYHLTTNEIITIDGDKATQKCYLQFFVKKDGLLEGYICVYDDLIEREDGKWKFARRDVTAKDKFTRVQD